MTEEKAAYGIVTKKDASNLFFDPEKWEWAKNVIKMFSTATLLPEHFRGNAGNCMILLNLASRLDLDPVMLSQKIYIISGRPGIEAQLKIALFNACGRFTPIRWKHQNENTDQWVCRAFTTEKSTEAEVDFVLDWGTVKKERWTEKAGSKWKTMPRKMLMYRSASWLIDLVAPEVSLGLPTKDELAEAIDVTPDTAGQYRVPVSTQDKLTTLADESGEGSDPGPDVIITDRPEPEPKQQFRCSWCDVVAKSKSGLTRHMNKCPHNPDNQVHAKHAATAPEMPRNGGYDVGEGQTTGIDLYANIDASFEGTAVFEQLNGIVEGSERAKELWVEKVMPGLAKKPIKADETKRLGHAVLYLEGMVEDDVE